MPMFKQNKNGTYHTFDASYLIYSLSFMIKYLEHTHA
jgi:hypothetical protein